MDIRKWTKRRYKSNTCSVVNVNQFTSTKLIEPLFLYIKMSSVNTAVHPDKETVYYQGSLAQMQARQFSNINRDNVTFLEIVKAEPRKQSYTDTTEFDERLSKFSFLSNKFIYKKVIDDARVIPDDIVIKNRMDEYFSPRFYKNIQRLYQNAPLYFDYLFSREGIAEQRHKQYSVYIYTLCLIEYIMKHYGSNDFKVIKDNQLYYDWALPKYSEQVSYIIKGPLSKSSSIKIDFKKHYGTIMNPSNVEGDMTQTLQLASLQNLDIKLNSLLRFLENMPNPYDKLADSARTYNLIIRSLNTKCYNEPTLNNTFVIDLRGSDFGETSEALQKTANLNTVVSSSIDISSRLSIHKLQELFNRYSRFRIVSLSVGNELYKMALDSINMVQVVFHGVEVASRSVMLVGDNINNEPMSTQYLTTVGTFSNNPVKRAYEFKSLVDTNTYDSSKVRVTDARIYLSINGTPLNANYISTKLDKQKLYNVTMTKRSRTSTIGAKNASIVSHYQLNYADEPIQLNPSCYIMIDNLLVYTNNPRQLIGAFNNNTPYLYESKPLSVYTSVNMMNSATLQDWNGHSDTLQDILNEITDPSMWDENDKLKSSVIIPFSNNAYVAVNGNDIPSEIDIFYSLLAITRPDLSELFAPITMADNTLPIPGNYLVMRLTASGEYDINIINQAMFPSNNINGAGLSIVVNATNNKHPKLDCSFNDSLGIAHTFNIFQTIAVGDTIKVVGYQTNNPDSLIHYTGVIGSFQQLNGTDVYGYPINWQYDILFTPSFEQLSRIFTPHYQWSIFDMTVDAYTPINRLLSINAHSPILDINNITKGNTVIMDKIELTNYGDTDLVIIDTNTTSMLRSAVTYYGELTIMSNINMPTIYKEDDYTCGVYQSDLFNMQVEFS